MILNSVVPVFFVMAIGYLAGWVRDIDNRHIPWPVQSRANVN